MCLLVVVCVWCWGRWEGYEGRGEKLEWGEELRERKLGILVDWGV